MTSPERDQTSFRLPYGDNMVEVGIKDVDSEMMRETSRRKVVKDELNRLLKFPLLSGADVAGDFKKVGVGVHAE